jgi:hypothetical protein
MAPLTSLAKTSIILSWLMVGLASISIIVQILWLSRFQKSRPSVGDICVWVAFVVGIVLVAQTTWAIIDEGSGKHQSDVAQQNLAAVAKVSRMEARALWLTDNYVVSHHQRGPLVDMRRLDTSFWLLSSAKHIQTY